MVKKFLITGGCGFIGTSLIRKLVSEDGHFIRVLDNLSVGTRKDLEAVCAFTETKSDIFLSPSSTGASVELIVGDIRNQKICEDCCKDVDVIIHLAANTGVPASVENPRLDMESNVIGTFNMLEGARTHGVKRFIFASSGAPAGEVTPPIHEELPAHPVSPYGSSKLAGEGYCSAYYRTFGIETVCLRFGNVYGPGSGHKNSVVAKFIKKAIGGEPLEIYGDGSQTRDFVYIDDLIHAILLSQSKPGIGGEVFQIATNKETTVSGMVELLLPILKENGTKDIHLINGEKRLGDVMRNFSDTSKAKRLLGWNVQYDLSKGLKETVGWFFKKTII